MKVKKIKIFGEETHNQRKDNDLLYLGRTSKFFIYLGRDGAPRRPGVAARRPCLRRILSCATEPL
jgi:hypothetical protein